MALPQRGKPMVCLVPPEPYAVKCGVLILFCSLVTWQKQLHFFKKNHTQPDSLYLTELSVYYF